MKVTVGTVIGAFTSVLIGTVVDELLKVVLILGVIGVLLVLQYYLNELRPVIAGGFISITLWILAVILDPTTQIMWLAGLLVVTAILESISKGIMQQIVDFLVNAIKGIFEFVIGIVRDRV